MFTRLLPLLVVFSVAPRALADEDAATPDAATSIEQQPMDELKLGPRPARGFAALDRPTGIAEAGFGWLTLPGAEVCATRTTKCKQGDTSFDVDMWQIFRANLRLAFGAGVLFGLIPTTDAPRKEPDGIDRDHKRQYLTVEGTVRYYPYVGENIEWWLGVTGGLVIVSDRFATAASTYDGPVIGPQGVTIRTEGGTIGAATGIAFSLAPHWTCGGSLRYGNWFLPEKAATDPLIDEASLTGRNTMFAIGLNIAYRTSL
jgi:hypothetical protein